MKRLIIIASLAMLAVGCQKTEIQNEVQTPIGFSTEVGKQTRAIVDGADYGTTQPFAVYAYGHQGDDEATLVMNNVEISHTDAVTGDDGSTTTPAKWAATGSTKYYWPNDPTTTLNFYAYSPALVTSGTAAADHQKLNGTIVHNETESTVGLTLTGYKHTNMYVDFMVATPVLGATYSNPDADANTTTDKPGTVPVKFNHQMTQIVFNVTTDKVYPGVTFTVENIQLKNIKNTADYAHSTLTPSYVNTSGAFTHGVWTNQEVTSGNGGPYVIFPADTDNGAVFAEDRATVTTDNTLEAAIALAYAENATELVSMTTTGVTMIPQNMVKATTTAVAGQDSYAAETAGQMFMITYSISGTGVAVETVTKHVPFFANDATSAVNWSPNQKITYTVKIGLNEILFEPTVANWDGTTGTEYTFQQ